MTDRRELETKRSTAARGRPAARRRWRPRTEEDLAWFARTAQELLATASGIPPSPTGALLRGMKASQELRAEYLPEGCRRDVDWALVAELLLASLEGSRMPMSSLGMAAGIPYTTALNHIRALTSRGLFLAVPDPNDRRRTYIQLSPELEAQAKAYLTRLLGPTGTTAATMFRKAG